MRRGLAGRIQDLGVKDPANMGAAMALPAADSIYQFLEDTHTTPQDYDGIFTGDLGAGGLPAVVSVFAGKTGWTSGRCTRTVACSSTTATARTSTQEVPGVGAPPLYCAAICSVGWSGGS